MNTKDLSSLTAKTRRKTSINSIENHINKNNDKIALSPLKQSILWKFILQLKRKLLASQKLTR